jgi:hypothetical protein
LDALWSGDDCHPQRRQWAIFAFCLLLVQPIDIIRCLPVSAREHIFAFAKSAGWLDQDESQRNAFAREYLRLSGRQERLYYPIQPILRWLTANTSATDLVLTNRDDLYILPARVIGTSNGFLKTNSASLRRLGWSIIKARLNEAIRRQDLDAAIRLGHECAARFAVVPWPVPGAAFQAGGFSVIDLGDAPPERESPAPQ